MFLDIFLDFFFDFLDLLTFFCLDSFIDSCVVLDGACDDDYDNL